MKETLRSYYTGKFADDCGEYIDPAATFEGLFETLDNYRDVYGYIGVGDSLIRERLFKRLAEIMGVGYDEVYEQWLRAA